MIYSEAIKVSVLHALQVFDVATSDMLLEMRTSRLSTVQYCHACPNSNLLAVALSHYTVEVRHTDKIKATVY